MGCYVIHLDYTILPMIDIIHIFLYVVLIFLYVVLILLELDHSLDLSPSIVSETASDALLLCKVWISSFLSFFFSTVHSNNWLVLCYRLFPSAVAASDSSSTPVKHFNIPSLLPTASLHPNTFSLLFSVPIFFFTAAASPAPFCPHSHHPNAAFHTTVPSQHRLSDLLSKPVNLQYYLSVYNWLVRAYVYH